MGLAFILLRPLHNGGCPFHFHLRPFRQQTRVPSQETPAYGCVQDGLPQEEQAAHPGRNRAEPVLEAKHLVGKPKLNQPAFRPLLGCPSDSLWGKARESQPALKIASTNMTMVPVPGAMAKEF